jgi:hypothetical protein
MAYIYKQYNFKLIFSKLYTKNLIYDTLIAQSIQIKRIPLFRLNFNSSTKSGNINILNLS